MNIFTSKLSMLIVSTAIVIAVGTTATASATVALSNATSVGNQSYGGSLGQFFDVAAPNIIIQGLGVYDSGQDGIANVLSVEIWKGDGSATVTPQVDFGGVNPQGTLIGNYRFQSITPVILPTGKYLVNAWGFSSVDMNGNTNLSNPPVITGNTGGGLVAYDPADLSQYDTPGGVFPTDTGGVTNNFQFAAGNFQFTAVPEPGTYLLMGSLLSATMFLTWKKKRRKA